MQFKANRQFTISLHFGLSRHPSVLQDFRGRNLIHGSEFVSKHAIIAWGCGVLTAQTRPNAYEFGQSDSGWVRAQAKFKLSCRTLCWAWDDLGPAWFVALQSNKVTKVTKHHKIDLHITLEASVRNCFLVDLDPLLLARPSFDGLLSLFWGVCVHHRPSQDGLASSKRKSWSRCILIRWPCFTCSRNSDIHTYWCFSHEVQYFDVITEKLWTLKKGTEILIIH